MNRLQQFADENDVDYINFIPLQNDIGLDMSQDTYDAGLHLNTTGAEKWQIISENIWLKIII